MIEYMFLIRMILVIGLCIENQRLHDALQKLYDLQNGPPLPTWERQWIEAMDAAKRALNE